MQTWVMARLTSVSPRPPGPRLGGAATLASSALVVLIVGHELGGSGVTWDWARWGVYTCAAGVLLLGVAATRVAARQVSTAFARAVGVRAPIGTLVRLVGYLMSGIAVLAVIRVDLSQFLLGGAMTGVVLGIAAQQSLASFFAGLVLLIARPYVIGDHVTIYSGTVGGPHEGTVADTGLLYTVLATATGTLQIPNSVLLTAAVRPQARPPVA